MITIAQVSDIHIGGDNEDCYGVDTRKNFQAICRSIADDSSIDYLFLTGDIAFKEPSDQIFNWAKGQLDTIGKPYFVLQGNHDLLPSFYDIYSEHLLTNTMVERLSDEYFNFVVLDTAKARVTEQMVRLAKEKSVESKTNVIFMHHPPLKAGVRYMDAKYDLKNKENLIEAISENTKNIVFCGHFHCDKIINQKNTCVFICPSTFFQIDQNCKTFKVDSYRSGYRKIVFEKNTFFSTVIYLD